MTTLDRDYLTLRVARTVRETRRDPHDYWSSAAADAADEEALRSTLAPAESREQALAALAVYWACALGAVVSIAVAVFR